MSRIGRKPIAIPAGVEVVIDGNVVEVKGNNGTLKQSFRPEIKIEVENGEIIVSRPDDNKEMRSLHGLTRNLVSNMVTGVSTGFTKELEINGVGYKAALQGKQLVLNLGYSHPINYDTPDGITFEVPSPLKVIIKGADKQQVGQVASEIRGYRPPEPYLGKGVKYVDEKIRRKAGKSGKSK
jgi:large subunit ribosomal protein L6